MIVFENLEEDGLKRGACPFTNHVKSSSNRSKGKEQSKDRISVGIFRLKTVLVRF